MKFRKNDNKRKAFTLIELIAVILILAIITLIAIPIVTNIVTTAQKEAFEVSCSNVYKALERYKQYEEMNGTGVNCMKVEFHNDREEIEIIDGIKYVPAKKLDLKGKLPTYGTGLMCNDVIELIADNEKYTCVVDETGNQVLEGALADNDVTSPVVNGLSLSSGLNTITVVVDAKDEDGLIVKYYYTVGEETYESENNYYTIEGLEKNTEYEVKVVAENKSGLKSEIYKESINTKELQGLEITESDRNLEGEYTRKIVYKITSKSDDLENIEYYFKSDVVVTVDEGIVVSTCGNSSMPGECIANSDTTLVVNTWYRSNVEPSITFTENGNLYALIGVGSEYTNLVTYQITDIVTSYEATLTYACPSDEYILDEVAKTCAITEYKQHSSCGTTTSQSKCGYYLGNETVRSDGLCTWTCTLNSAHGIQWAGTCGTLPSGARCQYVTGTTTTTNSCDVTTTIDATETYICPNGGTLNGTICEY